MSTTNRRIFLIHTLAGSAALAAATTANAQSEADASAKPVKETDAYPKSMGFRLKTQDVDKVKFPRHEVSQKCSSCQLYSGKEGDELGTCSFFKRQVPPEGWCRNYKPKKTA